MASSPTPADLMARQVELQDRVLGLPMPVVRVVRSAEEVLTSRFVEENWPVVAKTAEFAFFYSLCWFGLGFGWVLFFASVFAVRHHFHFNTTGPDTTWVRQVQRRGRQTARETEKSALLGVPRLPAWVTFPDFDRVEWLNEVLELLWPRVDAFATFFVKAAVEPELFDILDRLQLRQLSGLSVRRVDLGSKPLRLNGVKVYKTTDRDHQAAEEVVLDCDVEYAGDARVSFTLQGLSAEVRDVRFRGMARVHLKPLLHRFPFAGGFDLYFLTPPTLDYSLGGVGSLGEVPGINGAIRSVVNDVVRSRFVWPAKLSLRLPGGFGEDSLDRPTIPFRRPAGLLQVHLKEARDLLKKDKHIGGSGKSDPYAIVTLTGAAADLKVAVSFRDRYVAKTVHPVWNYTVPDVILEWPLAGKSLNLQVLDYDSGSADDFLGRTSLPLDRFLVPSVAGDEEDPGALSVDRWVKLDDVKHGEVRLVMDWAPARSPTAGDPAGGGPSVVSLWVECCNNLTGGKVVNLTSRCKVGKVSSHLSTTRSLGLNDCFQTQVKAKTENPRFEEGFLLLVKDPLNEAIVVEVVDVKNISETSLGKVQLNLGSLFGDARHDSDDPEANMTKDTVRVEMGLEGGHPIARIVIHLKLFRV